MRDNSLVTRLGDASEPGRFFDAAIAQWMGFRRTANPNGASWQTPDGEIIQKLPLYTKYIQSAKEITDMLFPDAAVSVTFQSGNYRAQIAGSEPMYGATPAIAVCRAAIAAWEQQSLGR